MDPPVVRPARKIAFGVEPIAGRLDVRGAQAGEKLHAGHAYIEQTTAKMQMAELENIPASTEAWLDKLGHTEGAVLHHMFEEESIWFLELKAKRQDEARITARFREEYERYAGRAAAFRHQRPDDRSSKTSRLAHDNAGTLGPL